MKDVAFSLKSLPILHYETLPSTNTHAKELFLSGALSGGIVRADRQSAGRGRLGRSFFSENGLYMSLLLPPTCFSVPPSLLTSAAAVALCRVIRAEGYDAKIKWVNDILVDGKKVCGILTEAISVGGETAAYIVGIGVNTGDAVFPEPLRAIAGSLVRTDADALFASLLPALDEAFSETAEQIVGTCAAFSCVLGRELTFFGAEEGEGVAVGLAPDGGLLVACPDGSTKHLRSGEISVRTKE